ncbi:MAG: class I SAM-dependent methyltransferase [Dehalococcoidia bacterium]|nr:class I SAM-dependent methyltransferase [Dehalococcoidia bacterium]
MDALELWADQLGRWSPPEREGPAPKDSDDGWVTIARWQRRMARRHGDDDNPLLSLLVDTTDGRSTVLDIGAGAGRLAIPLSTRVEKVFAVEGSPAMRQALQERIAERSADNVEVLAGKWPGVAVPQVDVVICANVVYDVADLGPFLLKMNEVARLSCFVELTPRHPLDAFRELWQDFVNWTPPNGPTYLDAVACLRQLGIEPLVQVVQSKPRLVFEDPDEATAFYHDRLGLTKGSQTEQALRQRVAKRGGVKNGQWVPDWQFDGTVILSWSSEKPSALK